ncbi:unnamed protein product [Effrenium voratum]|uniref:Alkyl transferase n=1 Tax=Effrenium voratum TaxID=2562239 RepID=A0AA36IC73_9DINO|nr:unnamed protein product [Effrenium voratum]
MRCCRRRDAKAGGLREAVSRAAAAAAQAVGAAGGGWAVVAVLRAVTGASLLAKCDEIPEATDRVRHAELSGPVPQHVAVIMDGNRRFGRQRYGDSLSGHKAGGEKLREFIHWCVDLGVEYLTVFAFSTENWKRDAGEVSAMMNLFLSEVPRLGEHAMRHNVRVRFLTSDAGPLPEDVKTAIADLEERSSKCTGLLLNVCLSYGGRGDIISACRNLATQASEGLLEVGSIDEDLVKKHLLTGDIPDPDVLIRTSGERRLSNFLMFQLAYAEFSSWRSTGQRLRIRTC